MHRWSPARLCRAWHVLAERAGALIALGTEGHPPKTRRRLKSINVASFTIAISCALFALTYALEDFALYRGAAAINLAMMVAALSVPAFHRLNDFAGALFMAIVLLAGLFAARGAGRAAIPASRSISSPRRRRVFLVFELRRMTLIVSLIARRHRRSTSRRGCSFPRARCPGMRTTPFLRSLYITIVVTISIIVAVLVYYAFRTAEQAEAETEALLARILPGSVAERLKARPGQPIADSFDEAAVLFSDLVGFVPLARSLGRGAHGRDAEPTSCGASTGSRPSTAWRRSRPSATPIWR